MPIIAHFDRTTAKYEPDSAFDSPEALIGEPMMTRGEKLAALSRWQQETLHELTLRNFDHDANGAVELTQRLASIETAKERLSEPEQPTGGIS